MLFSRIVCDATSIQGATDSVENFPLLDILEGGLKLLHLNLIYWTRLGTTTTAPRSKMFSTTVNGSCLSNRDCPSSCDPSHSESNIFRGVYTYDMETPSIQVDTFCVNGGPDGIY
ncbi:unnamed protein product [Prunus armeniaca]